MAPLFRIKEIKLQKTPGKEAKKAAVLMLFYPDNRNDTRFTLILRRVYKGVHSNQIGFPGGKAEENDIDMGATALRETREEIGVPETDISIFKTMTKVYIPPSNFLVTPFLGTVSKTPTFIPEEGEVAKIIEVPIRSLMDDASIYTQKLTTSYAKDIEVPAFKLSDYTVWGATAMMLSEVKELLKNEFQNL